MFKKMQKFGSFACETMIFLQISKKKIMLKMRTWTRKSTWIQPRTSLGLGNSDVSWPRCPGAKPAIFLEEPFGESQWTSSGSAYSLLNSILQTCGSGFLFHPYRSSAGCVGSHFAGAKFIGFVCTHLFADL